MRHLPTSDEDKFSNGYANKVRYPSRSFVFGSYSRAKSFPSLLSALHCTFVSHTILASQKSSEWPQFNVSGRVPEGLNRPDRRNVTNPSMTLSPGLGDFSSGKVNGTVSGTTTPLLQQVSQGLAQGLSSRRGSPLSLGDTLSSITSARSVPATPLPGMPNSAGQLSKAPGTPLSGDPHNINGILSAQMSRQLSEDNELNPSLSRMPSGQYDGSPLSFNSIQSGIDEVCADLPSAAFQILMLTQHHHPQQYGGDGVYGLPGGIEGGRYNSYGFEAAGRGAGAVGATGSTALYHHNGAKYGFNVNGRPNGGGADGKMNGLHGPKHKRGDIDRECTSYLVFLAVTGVVLTSLV